MSCTRCCCVGQRSAMQTYGYVETEVKRKSFREARCKEIDRRERGERSGVAALENVPPCKHMTM